MSRTLFTCLAAILLALSLSACERQESGGQGAPEQGTGDQSQPAAPPAQ